MSGSDRTAQSWVRPYGHFKFRDRCAMALRMREAGVPTEDIARLGAWSSKQAVFVAVSRARKPWKYNYVPKEHKWTGSRAFGGALHNGQMFHWVEWDAMLTQWTGEGMTRPEMARRLSKLTGRNFTTNQVIGRVHRIRQAMLKKGKEAP